MLEIFKKHFSKLGYKKPTAIQKAVYQPLLKGKDVLGLSPTGSGKTVAFLLPLLTTVKSGKWTQLIIFEPSQELAIQTANVTRDWANLLHLKVVSLTGGANIRRQKDKLKRHPEIIVGTPGRIQVMAQDRKLKMSHLRSYVIDEADNLLRGTTLEVVRQIINMGPSQVQLSYFSATKTSIMDNLKEWFATTPIKFDVRKIDQTRGPVTHGLLRISLRKRNVMLKMLSRIPHFKALVFFNELKHLNQTYSYFRHLGIKNVAKLVGYQSQIPRQRAMRKFRQNKINLLLTTDIAARGLDIPKLPAVVNYDLPVRKSEYIHRVGRTGRMGNSGLVVNFGDDHDFRDLKHLLSGTDYRLKPIYFYHNEIMGRTHFHHILKIDRKMARHHPSRKKSRHRIKKSVSKRRRKHRKHKHTKNKGMRNKWRREDRKRK